MRGMKAKVLGVPSILGQQPAAGFSTARYAKMLGLPSSLGKKNPAGAGVD